MNLKRLTLAVLGMCAVGAWGCSEDVVKSGNSGEKPITGGGDQTCTGDKCDDTPSTGGGDEPCTGDHCDDTPSTGGGDEPCTGDHCDDKPIVDTCDNACEDGAKRCEGERISICTTDDKGCHVWSAAADCGAYMVCDADTNSCVEGCSDACTLGDKKCSDAEIIECIKDDELGCTHWSLPQSCGENSHCDAATNTCVAGCVDECKNGESVCADVEIRHCGQFDDDACLEFGPSQDCGTDFICDSATNSCVRQGCEVDCAAGEKVCDDSNSEIMACQPIAGSSCNQWVKVETCAAGTSCEEKDASASCVAPIVHQCNAGDKKCSDDGKSLITCDVKDTGNTWNASACASNTVCDAGKAACVATCTNACTEGASQCTSNGSKTQVCQKGANGCTSWVDGTTCGTAQTCNAGKCEYTCGSDCDPFSIVILPDTQNYTRYSSVQTTTYHKQMNWIVKNKNTSVIPNLKMVVHMGDITNDNTDVQWKIAKDAHKILLDAKVPFTIVNGNHDYRISGKIGGRSKTKFPTYFPESYLKTIPGYAGVYDKVNTYSTFKAGNQEYLVLNLEFAPRQETMCWANKLLQKSENKNKKVIITTHANLTHNAKYGGKPKNQFVANGASGSELWRGLTSRHSNIVMILNGHVGDSEHRADKGNNGNTVQQILTDYQFEKPCTAATNASCTTHCKHDVGAGNGWLRVLTFYPKENRVVAKTVSVVTGSTSFFSKQGKDRFYCSPLYKGSTETYDNWYPDDPANAVHQFEITYDFTTPMTNKYNDANYLGFVHRGINATSDGDQIKPVVATNDTGRLVYVWEDDSSDADGTIINTSNNAHDIYARVMNPESCSISGNSEIIINEKTSGHQSDPDVAMDQNGNFVVVWTDDNDNNGSTQVYMRGFNADGSQRFGTKTVNTISTRDQYQPKIAMAADGQFAVSWTDNESAKETPQIYVRGFKADGSEAFAQRAVADEVKGTRVKSDIFMADNHTIIVAWEDDDDGNGSTQARMRILNADGTSKTAVKTVNTESKGDQNMPSVSGKPDGSEFIVTWQNVRTSTDYSIMGARFNASGAKQGSDFTLSGTAVTQKVTDPQVCMNAKGDAKVVWYNPTAKDVKMRVVTGGAVSSAAEARVNSPGNEQANNSVAYATAKSYQPAIACTPNKDYAMITYADDNDGNGAFEIFAVGTTITKTSI